MGWSFYDLLFLHQRSVCLVLTFGRSANLLESCKIGLSFFMLITLCYTLDLTLPAIPSTTPLLWEVPENFQIIFFLYWRDKSYISCRMNWFLNSEYGPSDQIISVFMSLSITNSFECISCRNTPIVNLSLPL